MKRLLNPKFLMLLAALAALAAATHQETERFCLETAPRTDCRECTANDVSFSRVVLAGAAQSCTVGERINITVNVQWFSKTAQARYQVHVFIAMDGGDARRGTCYPYYLHGDGPKNGLSDTVNDVPVIGTPNGLNNNGPFPDIDGDGCGDISSDQNIWQTIRDVEFVCRDTTDDGTADMQFCMGWANNKNSKGCTGIRTAYCSTPAKCTCDSIDIEGLTVCSSQQLQCRGNDGQINTAPCEPVFASKVRITTSASATTFPPLSVLYANAYLDYQTKDQVLGLEYYDQTQVAGTFPTTTGVSVLREEILFPCKASAYNFCGATCRAVFSKNVIPRLFREGSYAVNVAAGRIYPDELVANLANCPSLPSSISVAGLTCYRKAQPIQPAPQEAISHIWGRTVDNNRWETFVAIALDGTIWELFDRNGGRGVDLAPPSSPVTTPPSWQAPILLSGSGNYNFKKYEGVSGCGGANPPCGSPTDVIFAIDQAHPTATGWTTQIMPLVYRTLERSSFSNVASRFGVSFSGGSGTPQQYIAPRLAQNISALVKGYALNPNIGGTFSFATLIRNTLVNYYCDGVVSKCAPPLAGSNPRRLVVTVSGPDSPGSTPWSEVWRLYDLLKVEPHVEAIERAFNEDVLLLNIVNGVKGNIKKWIFESVVASDALFLYRRLCPETTRLCQCGGLCQCAGNDVTCSCPATCASNDVCKPSQCVNANLGCQPTTDALICSPANNCQTSVCRDDGTGKAECNVQQKSCTTNNKCKEAFCDLGSGCSERLRSTLPADCVTTDPCLVASCNPNGNGGLGACVLTPLNYSLTNPTCGVQPCSLTGPDRVCPQGTPCNPVTCIRSRSQCDFVPAANQTACRNQFDVGNPNAKGYYCSFESSNCAAQTNACNIWSCNPATGGCINTPVTCTNTNACKTASCNNALGCQYADLTQAQLDTLCPPRRCQVAACDNNVAGKCVYTPSTSLTCACENFGCPADTPCTETVCINTQQQCTTLIPDTNPAARNACATNITAGQSYCHVSPKPCPAATTCKSFACNATTGACDETPVVCDDSDKCTVDSCATGTCVSSDINLNPSLLNSVCPPKSCNTVQCTGNACVYTVDESLCGACLAQNPPIPNATFCQASTCVDAKTPTKCSDLIASQRANCNTTVTTGVGFFVGQLALVPGPCPPDTACDTYQCNDDIDECVRTPVPCVAPNPCYTAQCDNALGCQLTELTQAAKNRLCGTVPSCRIATCSNSSGCVLQPDPSRACLCENDIPCQTVAPDTFCTQTRCINDVAGCNSIVNDSSAQSACLATVNASLPARYCHVFNRTDVCQPNTDCVTYQCVNNAQNNRTGSCVATNVLDTCPAGNKCQKKVCNTPGGCALEPLSDAEQAAVCNDNDPCTQDRCNAATGECEYPAENPLPTECNTCATAGCPASTPCVPVRCYEGCTDGSILDQNACNSSIIATGTYCESQPIQCPADDVCNIWSCNSATGICESAPNATCTTGDPCRTGQCSVSAGGCIYSDPCLSQSFGSRPCQQPKCVPSSNSTSGFVCFSDQSPERNCSDYRCTATNVDTQILVGAAAQQFMTQFASQNPSCVAIQCTRDFCDPNLPVGCVNEDARCTVSGTTQAAQCNASIGCYEAGNEFDFPPGVCQEIVVVSLFDFCGLCLGNNIDCFFSSVNNAGVAGGIAAGVVAGVVVAAVVAALLAVFLSKKGYDYYQAQSQLKATGLQNNPAFVQNSNQGLMPDSAAAF